MQLRTRDRNGRLAYVWPSGLTITRDGTGRLPWSVYRPGNTGYAGCAMYDTKAEALADNQRYLHNN